MPEQIVVVELVCVDPFELGTGTVRACTFDHGTTYYGVFCQ